MAGKGGAGVGRVVEAGGVSVRALSAAFLTLIAAGALAWALVGTPAVILVAAIVPAVVASGLVLFVDRFEREPVHTLGAAFLWGAGLAALVSSAANDGVQLWLAGLVGDTRARVLTSMIAGPVVEELAKAGIVGLLLLVWPAKIEGVVDGIVYGALVGTGFALIENVRYFTLAALQGGTTGLARAVYLRGLLGGLNHAAFTATVGAGLGYARQARTRVGWRVVPLVALGAAIAQHMAWNGIASRALTDLLCNPEYVDGPCRAAPEPWALIVTAPLVVAAFIGPGLVILATIVVLGLRHDARTAAKRG